jgi:hypothetical protein
MAVVGIVVVTVTVGVVGDVLNAGEVVGADISADVKDVSI